jgi:hypothetical protein
MHTVNTSITLFHAAIEILFGFVYQSTHEFIMYTPREAIEMKFEHICYSERTGELGQIYISEIK